MYPNTNLQPGQTGNEVKKLQDFLVSKGLMTPAEVATGPGIYGPRTTAAVKKFQEQTGVDNTSGPGYWGPRTIAAASGAGSSVGAGDSGKTDPNQPLTDAEYEAGANNNPLVKSYITAGNTLADLENAALTGDFSGLKNQYGQPFLPEDIQDARNAAEKDNAAYYEALKSKENADTEAALAQKQADYQNYLLQSGQQFEADKAASDQAAANRGVLFSGARVQKEKNLQRSYEQDQAYKQANLGRDIANTAHDYQYKYGGSAAKGLSQYYKLGQNTFNPNVATGGVGSGGLSKVYNPSQYDYKGTRIGERAADVNYDITRRLTNRGNKLLTTGYSNQIN